MRAKYPDAKPEEIYRPWSTRFDVVPAKAPTVPQPEFREGYQRFVESNPHRALAPNSADRNAESTAILVFVVAALGTVIAAGLAAEQLQGAAHPEKRLVAVAVSLAAPWLLAMMWLVHVALQHFGHPTRGLAARRWQCDAAVWYLLVAPIITALTIISQVVWFSGIHVQPEQQMPMGQMMLGAAGAPWARAEAEKAEKAAKPQGAEQLLRALAHPVPRLLLLACEAVVTVVGVALALFDRQVCEPEVSWSVVALATATATVLVVAPVALGCGWAALPAAPEGHAWAQKGPRG